MSQLNDRDEKTRAVVLLSGGMDSCVCAALAARDPGGRAAHQLRPADGRARAAGFSRICDRLGIRDRLVVRNEALRAIGGSALTDRNIAVPESHALSGHDIPVTYVPFRNAHFLSAAVSWAEVLGAERSISARWSRTVRDIPIAARHITRRSTKWSGGHARRPDRNRDAADPHAQNGDCAPGP